MRERKFKSYVGERFGRLVVLDDYKRHYFNPNRRGRKVLCRCDCGVEKYIFIGGLKKKKRTIQSCGCLTKEVVTSHGMKGTRPYRIWNGMKCRCRENGHHRYGGRGITYDDKRETFEGFREDMEEGYCDTLSIDRIDNDGNYHKDNCRRATAKQQANNKSNNVKPKIQPKEMI